MKGLHMKQPPPSPTPGITRVSSLKILGVTFQDNLSMQQHVDGLIVEASNMLYAMNILRSHGMPQAQLYEVFRSKILSKFLYAAPSWWGFANQRDIDRINGFLKRSKWQKFYPDSDPLFEELCARADDNLFAEIARNNEHVLHRFLPPKKIINYSLRDRKHPYTLPTKDDRNFFNRVLFKLWQSFICILILLLMLCLICGLTDYGIKKRIYIYICTGFRIT